ncbi:hypothetical protein F5Y12DRAFT_718310 [Xylaria sp. FL1777]|nr:hypothetical protein F5Y12DRAFT_718310 [Xylaria sp. FL1777]
MTIDRKIDLSRTKLNILTYQGELRGGLSGTPIIRNIGHAAIGIHVCGGTFNTAVVIGGDYGVQVQIYKEMMEALQGSGNTNVAFEVQTDAEKEWMNYVDVPVHP